MSPAKIYTMPHAELVGKLHLLNQPMWPYAIIEEHFGINLGEENTSFLAQYRIWAERFRTNPGIQVLDTENRKINRLLLELFLQNREWISEKHAAIRFGMDIESFRRIIEKSIELNYIGNGAAATETPSILNAYFTSSLYKRIPELSRLTFGSYNSFVRRFQEHFMNKGVHVCELYCTTSLALGGAELDYARDFDCITGDPMGIAYKQALDTPKPIQLSPDYCSWITYAKLERELRDRLLGRMGADFEQKKETLINSINNT